MKKKTRNSTHLGDDTIGISIKPVDAETRSSAIRGAGTPSDRSQGKTLLTPKSVNSIR